MNTLNCKGTLLDLSVPAVMGILNVTPDSFFDGNRYPDLESALNQATHMINDGADIIDIGGMSSRPGAKIIDVEEELDRVIPVIKSISEKHPQTIISIDTIHAEVARHACEAGASMINDISAGKIDTKMYETVASLSVPYVLMHMQGRPSNMQSRPVYENVNLEIITTLSHEIRKLRSLGIKDIIIDPGFGFGKRIEDNYEILDHLNTYRVLDCPILIGLSRKSMIHKVIGKSASEALNGTTALHMIALERGVKILRVHDVKEAKEVVLLWKQLDDVRL